MEHVEVNRSLSAVIEAAYERHPDNYTTAADHAVMLISRLPEPTKSGVIAKLVQQACRERLHGVTESLRDEVKRRGGDTLDVPVSQLASEAGRSQQQELDTLSISSARPARRPVPLAAPSVLR